MRSRAPLRSSIALMVVLGCAVFAVSQNDDAAELSVQDAFRAGTYRSMQLSPDGKHIAAMVVDGGAPGLVLVDADTLTGKYLARPITYRANWIAKDMLAVEHLLGSEVIDLDGKRLFELRGRYLRNVRPNAAGHERILVTRGGPNIIDLIDTRTGSGILANVKWAGNPIRWIFDDDGIARVVTTINTAFWSDATTITHWYRESAKDDWTELASFSVTDDYWNPAYVTHDGRFLAIVSSLDRDTRAYFLFDPKQRKVVEMMAGHPTQDIDAYRGEDENYEAVVTRGLKPELLWFDGRWAGLQRAVDAALPGRLNDMSGDPNGRVLIHSFADVDPGRWYLLDAKTMAMRLIAQRKPHIDPAQMRPMESITYPALDGLTIPAYLTLPKDAAGPLPAVILIHGGPTLRDRWAWDPEVQLLASRGYVVFQPQFRGSSGFGKRLERAGYGQWGLAMQDDVTAGVRWLIDKGYADPKRICIYGASYGGYAAMWGLIKTPELYRCGISFAGISDIEYMLKDDSDRNKDPVTRLFQETQIGDLARHKQQFDEVSPLKKAALITVPVLIAHGSKDVRVPIEHSKKMVEALERNGKQHEWLELEGEGHSIGKVKSLERFYDVLFRFLDRHIGSGANP